MSDPRRKQPRPCPQIQTAPEEGSQLRKSSNMASSCRKPHLIIPFFVGFLLLARVCPLQSAVNSSSVTVRPGEELAAQRRLVGARLKKVNKPALKTVKAQILSFSSPLH